MPEGLFSPFKVWINGWLVSSERWVIILYLHTWQFVSFFKWNSKACLFFVFASFFSVSGCSSSSLQFRPWLSVNSPTRSGFFPQYSCRVWCYYWTPREIPGSSFHRGNFPYFPFCLGQISLRSSNGWPPPVVKARPGFGPQRPVSLQYSIAKLFLGFFLKEMNRWTKNWQRKVRSRCTQLHICNSASWQIHSGGK